MDFERRILDIANDKIYKSSGTTIGDEPKLQTYMSSYIKYSDLDKFLKCAEELKVSDNCNILRAIGMIFKTRGNDEESFIYFKKAIDKGLPLIDDGIICKSYDNQEGGFGRYDWVKEAKTGIPAQKYKKYAIDLIEYAITKSVSKSFVYLYYLYIEFYPTNDEKELDRRIEFVNEHYESLPDIVDRGGMNDEAYCNMLFKILLETRYDSLINMYRMLKYMPGTEEAKHAEDRFEKISNLCNLLHK